MDVASVSGPHAMLLTLVLGCLTLAVVVGSAALWMRLPPRAVCPSCGEATEGVVLAAPLRFLQHLLRRRWCPACRWTGFGRNGPVLWARRGPVAHDSGFQWNALDLPPDMGFRWGSAEGGVPDEAPLDPPGFRWGGEPGEHDRSAAAPQPSGFRWARADVRASHPPADAPSPGFRWADEGAGSEVIGAEGVDVQARRLLRLGQAERAVGFRWGGREGGDGPEVAGPSPGR